jgi:ATP-dependent DNA ligase
VQAQLSSDAAIVNASVTNDCVKPKIVVEVSFVEWTRDGLLRHPEFVGVRADKSPREVLRDQ